MPFLHLLKSTERISAYISSNEVEIEVECLIIPHLTQCHCRFTTAKMNCLHFVLKSKIDV